MDTSCARDEMMGSKPTWHRRAVVFQAKPIFGERR
jgi:hypothetical protein